MERIYERCCGLDVHKSKITACLREGQQAKIREFGTMTHELMEMTRWLKEAGCQIVAMESTGSYWKPLYNVFEMEELPAMVVNANHMKAIPGRKTDKSDAAWIADLLQHGLLRASFVPDREQRELRELTRYRKSRIEERAREVNRLQKMLEGANIKLADKLADIMGKNAQRLLDLAINEDSISIEAVEKNMHPRMKSSAETLLQSLRGIMTPMQRKLFREILCVIQEQGRQIARIEALVDEHMDESYKDAAKAIEELPGIKAISAQQILAEMGTDMGRFPSERHICSWAGVCPSNNESAGKRRSGRTNRANKALKTTLVQCAKSAAKHKDSYFSAQHQRLVVRMGANKATMAVAHSMLIAIYHVLKGKQFIDLGADYYNQWNREKKILSHIRHLERLGFSHPDVSVRKILEEGLKTKEEI